MIRSSRKQTVLPIMGLDTSKPGEWITDQNSPNCVNVDAWQSEVRKRYGFSVLGGQVGGTAKQILAGVEFKRDDVTYVLRIGADQVENLNTATLVWNNVSASALDVTEDDEVSVATPILSGQRLAVFTSDAIAPQKWTGSGNHADLGGTPPKARYCEAFGPYLVLAHITNDGGNTYRTRVQWSDTANPEQWSTGNAGSVDLYTGGDITGLKTYGNYLSVHKRDKLYIGYLVSSTNVMSFEERYTPGTIAHTSIQNAPNGMQVYLAIDGVRVFNGSSSTLIDTEINEDIRTSLNVAFAYRSWSIIVEDLNEYWLGIPTSGSENPNVIYRFNYVTGHIYKNSTDMVIRSAFNYSNITELAWDDIATTWEETPFTWATSAGSAGYKLPMIMSTDGYSYRYDKSTTNDNALPVESIFDTKDYHVPDELGRMVRWNRMELWARGLSVQVLYSTDKGATYTAIETVTLNSEYPSDASPIMLYFDVVSANIRFRFYDNSSNGSFYIKQFVMYGTPREMRGV